MHTESLTESISLPILLLSLFEGKKGVGDLISGTMILTTPLYSNQIPSAQDNRLPDLESILIIELQVVVPVKGSQS